MSDTATPRPTSAITSWHAHVYYDPAATHDRAARLRGWIAARFPAAILGRWHDVAIGPHTQAMYQVAFPVEVFPGLVPFLALNRDGLSVLVHPETGHAYDDHLVHALWLGTPLAINGSVLPRGPDDD
jgi:DOPA 4,5-dioxygenase